jgi:dipeptidyl aminopeptidase/acylaminoacyl peptidase
MPWDNWPAYDRNSPTRFVKGVTIPTFFISGWYGIQPADNAWMYWAWRSQGVPAQLAVYRNEGHVPIKAENVRDILERVSDWLDRWVKPGPR